MQFENTAGRAASAPARMTGAATSFNLPLGIVIGGPALFMIAGALIVVGLVRLGFFPSGGAQLNATLTPSPTITLTSAPTETFAPTFTPTAIPPIQITVQSGESCLSYAYLQKIDPKDHVSFVNEIIKLNKLSADCTDLRIGQDLLIPQPTPTQPPPATATFSAEQKTRDACDLVPHEVKEGESLAGIAANYNVSTESLREINKNIDGDTVFSGFTINIPLCRRLPTPGPTPTPTIPPPYPGPNLLTPKDGVVYGQTTETVALQWAAVDTLRDNELYQVVVEDLSASEELRWVDYVRDTRIIVPTTLRPTDSSTHVFRWSVSVVRQTGSTDAGEAIYVSAGNSSERRVFAWGGTAPAVATQTP